MPTPTTFTLGPSGSYFFSTPTATTHHSLPSPLLSLLNSNPSITILTLALSPSGSYFLSYRTPSSPQILTQHHDLPNPLVQWLYNSQDSVVRDLETLSVSLGEWGGYYAWDCWGASWSNLPPGLEKAVLKRLEGEGEGEGGSWRDGTRTRWKGDGWEAPCFVSLGNDGAFFMRTVSGGGCWDFKVPKGEGRGGLGMLGGDGWEGLRGVNGWLEGSADFRGVAAMHLMPTQGNAYVLVLTNGKTFSNLPEHTWADYAKVADKLPNFVQHMAPIPPMPVPPQQIPQNQTQQQTPNQTHQHQHQALPPNYKQSQRAVSGCCPTGSGSAPHTCCPSNPVQTRPWPLPPVNAPSM